MKARLTTVLACFAGTPCWAGPVVTVAQGRLDGSVRDGVAAFKAIPYAMPPVGSRRWRAPLAPAGWHGVRSATAFGPVCPQAPVDWAGHDLDRTSEDCLTLNVWTPRPIAGAHLPVMVWFHGGGHTAGAGSQSTYEGTTLARRGVVIVTVNYRLGALGYLAHPALSRESPLGTSGNYGLLDQIESLRWVRANIARFGGDPGNVTVFGQSAGGGSAMLVTTSPLARGLFAKAIFESGAALGLPGAQGGTDGLRAAENAGLAFARKLGATSLARLRSLPVSALIAPGAPRAVTSPVVDGKVVPLDITAAYRARRDAGVPILLGWNSDEAARFVGAQTLAGYAASARRDYNALAPGLLRLYPAGDAAQATQAARDLMSDTTFGWRGWSIAEARVPGGSPPLFLYQFDNPPPGPEGQRTPGAVHSDELGYVWGNNDPENRWPAPDQALARTMQSYWVNFARTGDPNGPGLPRWEPYHRGRTALWFSNGATASKPPLRAERLKQLDDLLQQSR